MVAMANANETEHIKEMEERKCGNFAAVIQKLKVFFVLSHSSFELFSHNSAAVYTTVPSEQLSLSLAAYNQFQHHNVISSLRLAYAIPPRYFMY